MGLKKYIGKPQKIVSKITAPAVKVTGQASNIINKAVQAVPVVGPAAAKIAEPFVNVGSKMPGPLGDFAQATGAGLPGRDITGAKIPAGTAATAAERAMPVAPTEDTAARAVETFLRRGRRRVGHSQNILTGFGGAGVPGAAVKALLGK